MNYRLLFCFSILTLRASSQVPVSREPRHHVVFENNKVRILNVLLPVGDTSQYHVHNTPSLFIGLTTTHIGSQLLHGQPVAGLFTAGHVFFENLGAPHTRIHRVWNTDSSVFHVMDIELLTPDSGFKQKPILSKNLTIETDTDWVRTYRIGLANNEQLIIQQPGRSLLLVALSNAGIKLSVNNKMKAVSLAAGKFFWIKPNDLLKLQNSEDPTSALILIELR